jgi:tripartite-type tricarboxylate transporter receptor subunit TctC
VASSKRSTALPEVPALNETLPGFDADSWFGMLMPAGAPRDIVHKMNAEVQKILQSREIQDLMIPQGAIIVGSTPEQLADLLLSEVRKWGQIARKANVKID